jgi:hypothetical protein
MKDRSKVLERVKEGIAHHEKCVAKRVKGFEVGMRVNHQTFGKGEIVHVIDRIGFFQSCSIKLDNPLSLGAGETLKCTWVWQGHLEHIKVEKKNEKKTTKRKKRTRRKKQ